MRDKKFTLGPWHSCHRGKCQCKMVWSMEADHPVAKIEAGDWGDTYPAIKDGKPVMESIPYGSINEDTAVANANLIAAAPELLKELESHCDACMARNNFEQCSGCFTQRAIVKAYGE